MLKTIAIVAGSVILLAATVGMLRSSPSPPAPSTSTDGAVVAAPGRVEGRQDAIGVNAAIDGVLSEVLVGEGERVAARQIVARIDCHDVEADLEAAEARVREVTASRQRLLRGGREDARAEAVALIRAAEARFSNARLALERASRLFNDDQIIPRSAVDEAERNERVASADLEAARQHAEVVRAEPLAEERAAADAAVAAARWMKASLSARLGKCVIRSPIDGVVLRRHLQPGERVAGWSERPIVTIADLSSLRVRIEVDERDIAAVRVGQCVQISAGALGTDRPTAVVSRVSATMGRRHVQSGDPSEKADRDVLEVIADLVDRDPRLVSGLRVTAVFLDH